MFPKHNRFAHGHILKVMNKMFFARIEKHKRESLKGFSTWMSGHLCKYFGEDKQGLEIFITDGT